MPRLLITLFAFFILHSQCFIASHCLAETTWQSIGPFGGTVTAIVIDPTNNQTIYAGTGGGVFKSTNGGASWTVSNSGLTSTNVLSLAIDPSSSQTLYAGTFSGLFKTTNGGASWTASYSSNISLYSLAIAPSNSQTLYAGTDFGGIIKSTNGGASWTGASIYPATNGDVRFLAIDPSNSQTLYAGKYGSGIFKSTNGGASWTASNSGLTNIFVSFLAIAPSNSQTIYAVTADGIFKTTNGGASWTASGSGLTTTSIHSLAFDPSNSQTLYVGTDYGGVFKTTNGGASWTASNSGLTTTSIHSLAFDPSNSQTVYAGTDGGIFKSTNGGASWTASNSGLTSTNVHSLAFDPTNSQTLYIGTDGGGVFRSTNGGATWTASSSGLTNTYVYTLAIDPSNSQTLYVGTDYGGVFKSTNVGASWTASNSGLTNTYVSSLAIDQSNSQTLYAGTLVGVFKSTNGGTTWMASNSGLKNTYVQSLAIDHSNSQTLYAGTYNSGIFKSTNGGASWNAASNGLTGTYDKYVSSLVIDPTNSQTLYAGTISGVFKTTNGGASWTASNGSLWISFVLSLAIDPTNSQTIYTGTKYDGVFNTTNGGATWTASNSGMTNTFVFSLAIDPTSTQTLYAGTAGGGAFKTVTTTNAPSITSPAVATFADGTSASYTLTADGSPKPTVSVSGTLPTGVTFDPTTGILSGTPASGTAGTYNLMFTASNGVPPDATRGVTLTVLTATPLNVFINTPSTGSKSAALTSITGTASGTGLAKVEIQITDNIYYLQSNGTFSTTPSWITATGTTTWSLNTSNVTWVDGITYTVFARASDGTTPTQPVKSTVKILPASSKWYTALSLDFTPAQLKSGDTTVASGKLMRLPDDGNSLAGLTVNLIVTPPSTTANPTPSPIIIPMTTNATGDFTSGTLTQFATPGVYITQIRFDGNSTLAACSTLPEPLYVNIQSGYAIIITGKANDNSLINQHTTTTDTILTTLKKRGFLDTNINYLKSTTTASVTKQQIQDAITVWARDKIVVAAAPLYIVLIDHGMPDGFVLDSVKLTPTDLKSYLDTLETDPAVISSGALTNFKRFIIIGSCYSGSFISQLSKPGRVIITSAAADEESLAGVNVFGINSGALYGGEYFVDTLFGFLGRGDNFKDAFNAATRAVSIRDPRSRLTSGFHYGSYDTFAQHPLLDDDGDSTASYLLNSMDGKQVATLTLGEGIRVNALGNPADIASVAPSVSLATTTNAQLWLKANSNPRVARAWAEIRRPGSLPTGGGSGQSIPTFEMIPLIYDGDKWIGEYTKFDISGTYDIYYYTKDIQTLEISPAIHSRIYKQQTTTTPPSAFNLLSPLDNATPAQMFPLTWQDSTDPDGLTYTLLVATDQNFTNIVYREENIQQAATYMPKNALKDPASTTGGYYCQSGDNYCYWKIQAIDGYGAIQASSQTWKFTIIETNQVPYYLTGRVISTTTGMPLNAVNVVIGKNGTNLTQTDNTKIDGRYAISLGNAGDYTATLTYTDFPTRTVQLSLTNAGMTTQDFALSVTGDTTTNIQTTLKAGWNLMGWTTMQGYYQGTTAPLSTEQASSATMSSNTMSTVFTSLGLPSTESFVIVGPDGVVYIPGSPFNTLKKALPGKAYWIYTPSDKTITVPGSALSPTDQLPLISGWNQIAYWGTDGVAPATGFNCINGTYDILVDEAGKVYMSGSPFNTLKSLQKNKGYFIHTTAPATLLYQCQ